MTTAKGGGVSGRAGLSRAFDPRLLALALAAGIVAGLGGVLFRWALAGVQWVAFGTGAEYLATALSAVPPWRIVLGPAVGGVLVALYFRYLLPSRRPLGPADCIEAVWQGEGRLPLGRSLLGTLANAASLGVGASVGREGPIVLLGGAIGAALARLRPHDPAMARILLAAGVAGCVAASFNAPLAAPIFALEAVLLRYVLVPLPALCVAAAAGALVGRAVFGAAPLFPTPAYALSPLPDLPAALLLGAISAALALAMMAGIFAAGTAASRVPAPQWLKTGLAGLALGAAALWLPHILGYGQEVSHGALRGHYGLGLLLVLVAAKLAATLVSFGGGFGGGVFSPALALGALGGGAFGAFVSTLLPGAAGPGAYAVLGAAAVAAPVLGAPVSTVLIVLEMTGAWPLAPGVALAVAVATLLCRPLAGRSFFTWQLRRRGIVAPG